MPVTAKSKIKSTRVHTGCTKQAATYFGSFGESLVGGLVGRSSDGEAAFEELNQKDFAVTPGTLFHSLLNSV